MSGVLPGEIQKRVQRGYLERLEKRVRQMRRSLAEKDWNQLTESCHHLKTTASGFGLNELGDLAQNLEGVIFNQNQMDEKTRREIQQSAEKLFQAIDHILVTNQMGGI